MEAITLDHIDSVVDRLLDPEVEVHENYSPKHPVLLVNDGSFVIPFAINVQLDETSMTSSFSSIAQTQSSKEDVNLPTIKVVARVRLRIGRVTRLPAPTF